MTIALKSQTLMGKKKSHILIQTKGNLDSSFFHRQDEPDDALEIYKQPIKKAFLKSPAFISFRANGIRVLFLRPGIYIGRNSEDSGSDFSCICDFPAHLGPGDKRIPRVNYFKLNFVYKVYYYNLFGSVEILARRPEGGNTFRINTCTWEKC